MGFGRLCGDSYGLTGRRLDSPAHADPRTLLAISDLSRAAWDGRPPALSGTHSTSRKEAIA